MEAAFIVGPTYYNKGFFNQTNKMVWLPKPSDFSNAEINIHCVGSVSKVTINAEIRYKGRNGKGKWINNNHKARIFSIPASKLVNWFKKNIKEGEKVIFRKFNDVNYSIIVGQQEKGETEKKDPDFNDQEENWDKTQDWFWEGNVQNGIITFLDNEKFQDIQCVDTSSKKSGHDIQARKKAINWIIEVKGYPSDKYTRDFGERKKGTIKRTSPATQARHWFSEALFTVILAKSKDLNLQVGLGFPYFETYVNYLNRILYARKVFGIHAFLVKESSEVISYSPTAEIK